MDDQNPYESPCDTERKRPSVFAFRWGSWTAAIWLLAAILAIALWDALVVERLKWESQMKRERQRNSDANTAPIVSESK